MTFKFAELYHDANGKRKFDVDVEGSRAISDLDVFAIAGKNKAHDIVRHVRLTDNELNIKFSADTDNAMISALKIERKRCFLRC
jgi:large repetitive protein